MRLTKKQEEVLHLLLEGLTLKQIAYKLGRSYDSVKSLATNFFKRNGFDSFTEYLLFEIKTNKKEITALEQQVAYNKRYKKMWDALKQQAFQEKRN